LKPAIRRKAATASFGAGLRFGFDWYTHSWSRHWRRARGPTRRTTKPRSCCCRRDRKDGNPRVFAVHESGMAHGRLRLSGPERVRLLGSTGRVRGEPSRWSSLPLMTQTSHSLRHWVASIRAATLSHNPFGLLRDHAATRPLCFRVVAHLKKGLIEQGPPRGRALFRQEILVIRTFERMHPYGRLSRRHR
jgi:hypothetical protein